MTDDEFDKLIAALEKTEEQQRQSCWKTCSTN